MSRSSPLLLVALLTAAWLAGCQKIDARRELKKGNVYYNQEAYKDALIQFEKGIEMDPGALFVWRSIGLSSMALFRPGSSSPENVQYADKAISAFQKYIAAFPAPRKHEKVLDYLITMYFNTLRFNEAIEYLTKYRQEHPEITKMLQPLVTFMVRAGKIGDAFQLALKESPNEAVVFYTIGVTAWDQAYHDPTLNKATRRSVVDLGLRSLTHAIEVKPDFATMAYVNLLYRERGKLTQESDKRALWNSGADAMGKLTSKVLEEKKRIEQEKNPPQTQPPQQAQPSPAAKPNT